MADKAPVTAAIRVLREHGVAYTEHLYRYEEHGGTRVSARELGVDERAVVKTLVMEDEHGKPAENFRHGNRNRIVAGILRWTPGFPTPRWVLAPYGLLSCTGDEARAFLHAQLTNDVASLALGKARIAGWCTAQGRLLQN